MKTLIIIVSPMTKFGEIADTKDAIVKYLGSRMIEVNPSEMPVFIINSKLDTIDQSAVVNIVRNMDDRAVTLFLESDQEIPDNAYFTLTL